MTFQTNYTKGKGYLSSLTMATCKEKETKRKQVEGAMCNAMDKYTVQSKKPGSNSSCIT
jgi:hypothetical protein